MRLCVVIPIYNECETIGFVVDSIKRKGLDVFVVNDGSTDESGNIAREHATKVLTNEEKRGKGASLRQGFEEALKDGYDGVITMDGDGQHDAEDLVKILRMVETHPKSVVNGTRMTNSNSMPFVRWVTNKIMSWMISCVCRQRIPDTQCGFRYVHADILRNISLSSTGYEIESEILIKASRAGAPVFSVPVRTIYSKEKSKIHPIRDTIRFIKYFMKELGRR